MKTMQLHRLLALAVAVAFVRSACADALDPQAIKAKLDQYLQASASLSQFSGAVLVAKNGVPILSSGYGFANAEWQVTNSPTTKYRVGSITKQFTATLIMMLQERGKLKVTDPICKYVPKCPTAWAPVTLHQVLTHTAGIPDYTELPDFKRTQALPTTPTELVARFKDLPLNFKPGAKFQYSNSGYVLLGCIIERVAGESYAALLQRHIFGPLHMNDSGYDDNSAIIARRAAGYTRHNGRLANAAFIDMTVPFAAGSIYSTVEDMLKWDQALYTTTLLPKKALDDMFTPYKDIAGYGWAIDNQFGRKMISHNGSVDGFVSNIARYPDDKATIVVLANLETAPIGTLAKDLAAIVFGQPYTVPAKAHYIDMAPEALARLRGRFRVDVAPDIVIEIAGGSNGGIICHVQGQTFELRPESNVKFSSEDAMATVIFGGDGTAAPHELTFNGQFKAIRIQ